MYIKVNSQAQVCRTLYMEEKTSQINQQCCIELAGNFLKLFDTGLIIIRDIGAKQLLF